MVASATTTTDKATGDTVATATEDTKATAKDSRVVRAKAMVVPTMTISSSARTAISVSPTTTKVAHTRGTTTTGKRAREAGTTTAEAASTIVLR